MTPFGPYQLESRLGQGGMAEVFLARAYGASGFEKRVVIKTLREELLGNGDLERMFLEEAKLQALLSHRNLVQAHDYGLFEGRPYVRLDWVDGVDLSAVTLPLEPPVARFIGGELALGLHALHGARDAQNRPLDIVHRDVSPRNVLLSKWGEVKLADFGIARATQLRTETRAGVRKGTYAYMSPEQVAGRALTTASDQFSLATLISELLTGTRPFDGPTPLDTMDLIREAAAPSLAGIDRSLATVLLRAFEKNPGDRFESARAFRKALLQSGEVADELELSLRPEEREGAKSSVTVVTKYDE